MKTLLVLLAGVIVAVTATSPAAACVKSIESVRMVIERHTASYGVVIVKGYCTVAMSSPMGCICGATTSPADNCVVGLHDAWLVEVESGEVVADFTFESSTTAADYFNQAYTTNDWNAFFSQNPPIDMQGGVPINVHFVVEFDPECSMGEIAGSFQGSAGGRIGTDGADPEGNGLDDHFEINAPEEILVENMVAIAPIPWSLMKRHFR